MTKKTTRTHDPAVATTPRPRPPSMAAAIPGVIPFGITQILLCAPFSGLPPWEALMRTRP